MRLFSITRKNRPLNNDCIRQCSCICVREIRCNISTMLRNDARQQQGVCLVAHLAEAVISKRYHLYRCWDRLGVTRKQRDYCESSKNARCFEFLLLFRGWQIAGFLGFSADNEPPDRWEVTVCEKKGRNFSSEAQHSWPQQKTSSTTSQWTYTSRTRSSCLKLPVYISKFKLLLGCRDFLLNVVKIRHKRMEIEIYLFVNF